MAACRVFAYFFQTVSALKNVEDVTGCALWSGYDAVRILCHDAQDFGMHPCTRSQDAGRGLRTLTTHSLSAKKKVPFEKCILHHGRLSAYCFLDIQPCSC